MKLFKRCEGCGARVLFRHKRLYAINVKGNANQPGHYRVNMVKLCGGCSRAYDKCPQDVICPTEVAR